VAGEAGRLAALNVLVKERVAKLAARALAVLNTAIEVLDLQVLALVGRIDLQELQAGAEHEDAAGAPNGKREKGVASRREKGCEGRGRSVDSEEGKKRKKRDGV